MLMNHQPVYSPIDYAADHTMLLDAIARRDTGAPELVRDHLRLSAKLIAGELNRISETAQADIDNSQIQEERSIGERRIRA